MGREQVFNVRDIITQAASESENSDISTTEDFTKRVLEMADKREEVLKESVVIAEASEISDVQGELYEWEDIADKVITIPSITDTQGYLSQKVQDAMDKYHVTTIPISIVGILQQVTELQNHTLLELNGVKYAMANELDREKLVTYRDAIYTSLSSGLPYKKSLFVEINTEDGSFKTLDLIKTEWDYICSLYKQYNPKLIITEDNDFILTVG